MRTRKKKGFWQSNANKKNFLLDLTKKLNIKEEDLKQLKWKDIKNEGGSGLIQVSKNLSNIFSLLSPTPFSNFNKRKPIGYWSLIENHYKHLEEVYCKYNFQSLEDWKKPLKEIKKIINCSLLLHYKHNFKKILIKLYPNYPWNFIMKKEKGYWEDIQNQRLFLESLFSSLKLNNLNQLNNIELIEKNGGRLLIKKYKYNTKLLLKTIFPDYKEEISDNILKRNKRGYWNSIDNQSLFMKHLFDDLNLKSEEEWGMMTWKDIMKKKGGSNLHRIYSGNLHKLFQSIFPTLSYSYHSTKSKLRLKLIKLQNEYQIRKKIDWYRIPSPNLISCLNFFHPDEKWHKIDFAIRRKKIITKITFYLYLSSFS